MNRLRRLLSFSGLLALLPALVHAHPGHEGHEFTWDLQGGAGHPWPAWAQWTVAIAVTLLAAQFLYAWAHANGFRLRSNPRHRR